MSIVVSTATTDWQSGSAYFGYENAMEFSDAVISATSEQVGFEAVNVAEWSASSLWNSAASGEQIITLSLTGGNRTVNSFGIYKHNLGDQGDNCIVTAQYSIDGANWVDLVPSFIQAENDFDTIFLIANSSVEADFYRLRIQNLVVPVNIGNLFFGNSLLLFGSPEVGWTPPSLARNNQFVNSRSDGGEFVGRSFINRGGKTGFQMSVVPFEWVKANWLPFMKAADRHPWYFSWDAANEPADVAYCYTDRPLAHPKHQTARHMTVPVSFIAL